jgi:hypothetical protein
MEPDARHLMNLGAASQFFFPVGRLGVNAAEREEQATAMGGDDMFTILFTEVQPALQRAKDIKKDFAEDLFLHSSKCDVKFGLSFVVFEGDQKEQQIVQCWGNAKDCCEFKGRSFRNRGSLLISQETLASIRSSRASGLADEFVPVQGESLKSGSQLFSFLEIAPLPE